VAQADLDEPPNAGPALTQRYVERLDAPAAARLLERSEAAARRMVLARLARVASAPDAERRP